MLEAYIISSPDFDSPVLRRGVEKSFSAPAYTCHVLCVTRQDLLARGNGRVPYPNVTVLKQNAQQNETVKRATGILFDVDIQNWVARTLLGDF